MAARKTEYQHTAGIERVDLLLVCHQLGEGNQELRHAYPHPREAPLATPWPPRLIVLAPDNDELRNAYARARHC